MIALTLEGIGHDFGLRILQVDNIPKQYEWISRYVAIEAPIDDIHGVKVIETKDIDKIPRLGKTNPIFYSDIDNIEENTKKIIETNCRLTNNQIIAIEAYNSSFFQDNTDIKFLLRVTAIEALIVQERRSPDAVKHIDEIIKMTQKSNLDTSEKHTLISSIGHLKNKSIKQAGSELASKYLGTKKYMNSTPSVFFEKCYKIRSELVHKREALRTVTKVSQWSAALEIFVREMLYQAIIRNMKI